MGEGVFVTAINCMDGRVQLPVIEFMKEKFSANYVDSITAAGPNRILADNSEKQLISYLKRRADISVNKHGSNLIAVVGHFDCAGNPNPESIQLEHLVKAAELVKSWGFGVEVIKLFVNEKWQVRIVE